MTRNMDNIVRDYWASEGEMREMFDEQKKRIAELEARIERAKRQINVSDRYAREATPEHNKVASVWEIQNGLIHDALSGVER